MPRRGVGKPWKALIVSNNASRRFWPFEVLPLDPLDVRERDRGNPLLLVSEAERVDDGNKLTDNEADEVTLLEPRHPEKNLARFGQPPWIREWIEPIGARRLEPCRPATERTAPRPPE